MLPFFDRFSAGACLLRSLKWRARAVAGSDFCHRESEINLPLGGASEDIAFVDGSSADGTEKRSFFCYETQFADEHPIRKKNRTPSANRYITKQKKFVVCYEPRAALK